MPASVIGISLNLGYPGNVSRNDPKATIVNRSVKTSPISFGVPVKLNADNTYDPMTGSDIDTYFAGIALRNVKQQVSYLSNDLGQYNVREGADVLHVGYVTVLANPTATLNAGGAVFAIFDKASGAFKYFDNEAPAASTPPAEKTTSTTGDTSGTPDDTSGTKETPTGSAKGGEEDDTIVGVLLPNAQWVTGGTPDANGVAEIALLSANKA